MREERGLLHGNQVISEPVDFLGSVSGDVSVVDGGKMYLRGAIYGNLHVEKGGRVHVFGSISGKITLVRGAKVIISGVVGGDVTNDGGRLAIDQFARIFGKLRPLGGKTLVDPKAQVQQ